jgi:uncharacterized protein YndB with AHSA1/START domain
MQTITGTFISKKIFIKMTMGFTINKTISIKADRSKVWKALADQRLIPSCLFQPGIKSGWTEGAKIIYNGDFNGIAFKDEGKVDIFDFEKRFQYSYWNADPGIANIPKHHVTVAYFITGEGNETQLEVTQKNSTSGEVAGEVDHIWDLILHNLKAYVE